MLRRRLGDGQDLLPRFLSWSWPVMKFSYKSYFVTIKVGIRYWPFLSRGGDSPPCSPGLPPPDTQNTPPPLGEENLYFKNLSICSIKEFCGAKTPLKIESQKNSPAAQKSTPPPRGGESRGGSPPPPPPQWAGVSTYPYIKVILPVEGSVIK